MGRQNDRYTSDNTPHRGAFLERNGKKGEGANVASSDTCGARPWIVGAGWRLLSLVAIVAGLMAPSFVHAASPNTWTSLSSIPIARAYLAGAAGPDGRIYAIGGRCGYCSEDARRAVDAYDPGTNTWTVRASLPTRRDSLAAATGSDGRIYAIGGCYSTPLSTVEAYTPSTNSWTAVAPMPTARCELAAVAAPDGRIYALGGFTTGGGDLATVEAYTPSTNSWETVAPMPTAREGLAAAVGPDGRIYAIGGFNANGGALSTVEAYTPSTNSWATVASLNTPREFPSAATGPDGRIYAIGGFIPGGAGTFLRSVEAYTPSTNSWTTVASLPAAQYGSGAVTGPDGRIYNFGGNNGSGSEIPYVEAYLTAAPLWSYAAPMSTARYVLGTATGSDGRIYAVGGYDGSATTLNSAGAYFPSSNSWATVAPMATARNGLAATAGSDGSINAVGGRDSTDTPLNSVERYTPSNNTWSTVAPMPTARENLAAATGSDGTIYAIGGYNGSSNGNGTLAIDTVEAYDPASNNWTTLPHLLTPRSALAATAGPDGRIYAIGGYDPAGRTLSSVEVYDPKTNAWTAVAPLNTPRYYLAAVKAPNGLIYAIGGQDASGHALSSVEVYNPRTNTWTSAPSMNSVRQYAAAAVGSDGRIYAIGGFDGSNGLNSVESYAPPSMPSAVTTTITLSSSVNPSVVGQQITYTAAISPTPDGGTVDFQDGGSDIGGCGAVPVDTSSGTATCQVTYTSTGSHTITAIYSGDSSYTTSTSDALTQTLNKASTATSLSSSQNPATVGQSVTVTATIAVVSPGAGSPSGTVAFDDNGTAIGGCASQPVSGGQATCTTSALSAGSHPITAVYSGDSNYAGSTSDTLTQTVTKIATTTSLSSSANPSVVGQPVTYTAAVSPVPDGGTVAFTDGGAAIGGCGSVTVGANTGTATCRVTYTATGGHNIAAAYSGDGTYAGSSSNTVNQTVNKASTTTSLTSSPNPAIAGQHVTYTATVSPAPDGGTVTFQDGGTTISGCGSQPVDSSGKATCPVTYATSGAHAITATYSGDSSYAGSSSNTVNQTVSSDLTTSLTLSPNPAARGQSLTISGTVTNTGAVSEQVIISSTITAPNGATTSYPFGTVTIGAGRTVSRTTTSRVPRNAPTGAYTVTVTAQDKTGSSSATARETVS